MKHFNLKSLALGAALAGSLFGANKVQAQDYVTDPNAMTVGYYYVVSSANPDYAWTVLPTKEIAVAKLDKTQPQFVWFLTGRNGKNDQSEVGTKITDLGSAYRMRFFFGDPSWTNSSSKSMLEGGEGPFYSLGGLNENADKQVFTIDTEWGMHNWQGVNDDGFRFSASNRGYDIAPQNGVFSNGAKMWYYGGGAKAEAGRWKLLPVEGEALEALSGITDVEAYIAALPAFANDGIVAECVTLAAWLQDIKANHVGTAEGQYNVSRPAFVAAGRMDLWTIWGNLDNYDAADDDNYVNNINDADALNAIKAQLEELTEIVKGTLVERSLGLQDVEIVTLQWNGAGRYSGINGGGKWENPSDFGSPNGGNGRIALVKADEGKYYIASQGLFIKINEEGQRVTADSKADATAFVTTRSSENGLTFVTEDGYYLTGSQFAPSTTAPTQDYKLNTFGNYANVSVADPATELNGIYYSSLAIPFKVQKPADERFHTFVMKLQDGNIVVEDVDVVPAGVPFLYVGPSKGDDARMPIPQENQEYSETIQNEGNLLDGGFLCRIEGDELTALNAVSYTLSVKDGKVGYFLAGGFTENTPANRGYITSEGAAALNAGQFELVYDAEAGTLEVVIGNPVAVAIETAIAKFLELNDVVTDAYVNNPGRYSYELTADDDALLDGNYDTAAGYAGLSLDQVNALIDQFQALIDAIKASRNTGLKDVNIVTLQWNGAGRYTGLNGRDNWANPSDFGGPNGANGKIGIIKKENGYVIASQGVFYKVIETVAEDETVTYAPGNAEDEDDATQFTVTGSIEDGLTFEYNGQYLNGSQLKLTADKPAQSYKVNTFDVATQHYAKASEDLIQVGDVYMAAIAIPFKVQKPEGEGYHTYIVNKDFSVEEVDVVEAGVPFIYVSPTNDGEAKRLIIPQENQAYAAVASTETLLSGFYVTSAAPENVFVFGTETETKIEGENDDAQYVTETVAGFFPGNATGANKGYIAADAVENAAKFQFVDGKLIVLDEEGTDITTGVAEVPTVRVNTNAIYNLNGVLVEKPVKKGLYIQNGKKVVVK